MNRKSFIAVFVFAQLISLPFTQSAGAQPGLGPDSLIRQTICDTIIAVVRRGDQEGRIRATHFSEISRRDSMGAHEAIPLGFPGVTITSPATRRYNCHGMTFDSSKNWVDGDIDAYLRRNGYKPISQCNPSTPQKGDVVIYRDPSGRITHSGTVDSVSATDTLVVSKWGTMCDLRHKISQVPDGRVVTTPSGYVYRSSRYGRPEIYRKC